MTVVYIVTPQNDSGNSTGKDLLEMEDPLMILHEWVGAPETGSGPRSWVMLHTFGCPPIIMGRDQSEGLSEGWGL